MLLDASFLIFFHPRWWILDIYWFCKCCSAFWQSGFQRLRDFPCAFWLGLFVEGTRFTQAKLLAAQEYASSMGLPSPRNVLIPRTKVRVLALTDFSFLKSSLFKALDIIYYNKTF